MAQPIKDNLNKTLDQFMTVTGKSRVAVIVPLYGFWSDVPNNPVNGEVLQLALSRIYSSIHQLYIIFVANPESIPSDFKDTNSVANILLGRSKMGNCRNIAVSRDATYPEYIIEGMECAVNETEAQFIVIFNPWVMIQEGGLDALVDRSNRADDVKVVSGYDLRSVIVPENFDSYANVTPNEEYDFSFDFASMPRFIAETIVIDPQYKTHVFLQRDIWEQVVKKGFAVIASQRIPIFPFEFPWTKYENREQFEEDRAYFTQKWNFDPGLIHSDPAGTSRKDKAPTAEIRP